MTAAILATVAGSVIVKAPSGSPRLRPEPKSNTGVTVTTRALAGIRPGTRAASPITSPAATPARMAHLIHQTALARPGRRADGDVHHGLQTYGLPRR